jgi:hypothetical protein
MKKTLSIGLILIGLWSCPLKADVIYSPFTGVGFVISLELIGSYELHFTRHNTFNIWGGVGAVSQLNSLSHPALGAEAAIEIRHYFKANRFQNFNIGLYTGFASMKVPQFYHGFNGYKNSVGLVPGLKLTYKKRINSWLVGEPYLGISAPWYADNYKDLSDHISHSDPGFAVTLGLRIGFNKVNKIKA